MSTGSGPAGTQGTSPEAQADLFDAAAGPASPASPTARVPVSTTVRPAAPAPELLRLADALAQRHGDLLRLGTSSWHFPGWAGQVWARPYPSALLSREGLAAYARHPLLRTVGLDRGFWRPIDAPTYAGLAAQVPAAFRFVVKAPALLTDALRREQGRAVAPNPSFLDPAVGLPLCAVPAAEGLGDRLGVLVLQLSPLPAAWLAAPDRLIDRLVPLWVAMKRVLPAQARLALELRDAALLSPAMAQAMRAHGVRYVLGLHDRMPPLEAQLPMLRALWPGPLVCRWSLMRGSRYEDARERFAPFDRLQAPDVPTRERLAQVIAGTLAAGFEVDVTINNKAEGSAPASVVALAQAVLAQPGMPPRTCAAGSPPVPGGPDL